MADSRFRVLSRIRPIGSSTKKSGNVRHTDQTLTVDKDQYQFDQVYGGTTTNELLYNGEIRTIVQRFCNGYNGCILAYGQSSSGKTHSITGTAKEPGIVPRVFGHIFDFIEGSDAEYVIRISYLEVYAERIKNLIGVGPSKVTIRSKHLVGEKKVVVRDEDHIFSEIAQANKNRITRKTNANERSSRSHTVLRIVIEQTTTNHDVITSRLDICDLAGSESADKSDQKNESKK